VCERDGERYEREQEGKTRVEMRKIFSTTDQLRILLQ